MKQESFDEVITIIVFGGLFAGIIFGLIYFQGYRDGEWNIQKHIVTNQECARHGAIVSNVSTTTNKEVMCVFPDGELKRYEMFK